MRFPVLGAGTFVLGLAVLLLLPLTGCREKPPLQFDRNKPPETFLTDAPAESSLSFYRKHLHWAGFDPDGYIAHYQWVITDSLPESDLLPWRSTTRSDSTFVFAVGEESQVLGRRFWVRSVDNEGKRDDTPAWVFFVSRDPVYPDVQFTRSLGSGSLAFPPRDTTSAITSTDETVPTDTIPAGGAIQFSWTGVDLDSVPGQRVGSVTGFRHKLNTREIDWVGGGLRDTTASYSGLPSGVHVFYVQAIDDAGLATDSFIQPDSRRSVVVNFDPDTWYETNADTIFTSDDEVGHVAGDTLTGGSLRSVVAHTSASDRDGSIAKLQYRVDGDNWSDKAGSSNVEIGSGLLRGGDHILYARGVDNLGRPDGTPATLNLYIGHKPLFADTTFAQSIHFVQFPREGEVVAVGSGRSFEVRFYATSPDPVTIAGYSYSLDDAPFTGEDPPLVIPDFGRSVPAGGYVATITIPDEEPLEGPHTLTVRASDQVRYGYTNNPRCEDCYNEILDRCDPGCMKEAGVIHFTVVRQAGSLGGRSSTR